MRKRHRSRWPAIDDLCVGIRDGNRAMMGRAITLLESQRSDDRVIAQQLLERLLPHSGHAIRVGITGVPGVGKSTLLDSLGMMLIERDHRVAVLAVDPSSSLRGGSILGDKTRMARLAKQEHAFIRPSPTGLTLGGVAMRTREVSLLCEAAGYDIVIIETVGVGQSEIGVSEMVDCFVTLMLPGAGDELQGIKKGLLELADIIVVNKSDGGNITAAQRAQKAYDSAQKLTLRRYAEWAVPTLLASGLTGAGLNGLWESVLAHRQCLQESGQFTELRMAQRKRWLWSSIHEELMRSFRAGTNMPAGWSQQLELVEEAVVRGERSPTHAAEQLVMRFSSQRKG